MKTSDRLNYLNPSFLLDMKEVDQSLQQSANQIINLLGTSIIHLSLNRHRGLALKLSKPPEKR